MLNQKLLDEWIYHNVACMRSDGAWSWTDIAAQKIPGFLRTILSSILYNKDHLNNGELYRKELNNVCFDVDGTILTDGEKLFDF